ncbi:MAG TPA: non-canonical purine NTP pyrophosphatase, partial [Acidimicrobiales bacterium]
AAAVCAATGLPAVADDSGLFVDALGGEPGVHAAYFAGPRAAYDENVDKLLAALDHVPAADRTAQFVAVALVRWPDGQEVSVRGVVYGRIATERRGLGGFGYDPIFCPVEAGGLTFAEMDDEAKHIISHRGRAFRALAELLDGTS